MKQAEAALRLFDYFLYGSKGTARDDIPAAGKERWADAESRSRDAMRLRPMLRQKTYSA